MKLIWMIGKARRGWILALSGTTLAVWLMARSPKQDDVLTENAPHRRNESSHSRARGDSGKGMRLGQPQEIVGSEAGIAASHRDAVVWENALEREREVQDLVDLANESIEAVAARIEAIPDPWRETIQFEVAASRIAEAPEDALFLAQDLPPGHKNDELLRHAAMEFAESDAERALAWIEEQEDEKTAHVLLSGVLVVLAKQDPGRAADLAVAGLTDGALRDRTLAEILVRWASSSPESAADFLLESAPRVALSVVGPIVSRWNEGDPEATERWISGLNDPELREAARRGVPSFDDDSVEPEGR